MRKKKSTATRKSVSHSKAEMKCEIDLVGGKYDGKKFGVVFPTPKYLVLSMGTELYERQDPDTVVEATYRYTEDWAAYRKWLGEQALIK